MTEQIVAEQQLKKLLKSNMYTYFMFMDGFFLVNKNYSLVIWSLVDQSLVIQSLLICVPLVVRSLVACSH